jgi:hypothetical protein
VAFDLRKNSATEIEAMNLTKVGVYSLIASIVAAVVAILSFRSRVSTPEVPGSDEYGEWDNTLGI